jgi:exopolyphosphatase/guanosine-5'-triphosphate,3'-diphosphate pyrophosphatase
LKQIERLGSLSGRSLYAVGGVWRSFARVDMERRHYPLHVLHAYPISRNRALGLCDVLARQSKKSLGMMRVVSRRRAEALPYGAIVLERLLLATELKEIVISAYGLREGLLFAQLPAEERAKDPLIAFAQGMNQRLARAPDHAQEMFEWMAPLFGSETKEEERARLAACLFSDIGWRRHPDDRALGTFDQVLTAPFAGASHRVRALIATAIFHRHSGDEDFPKDMQVAELLDKEDSEIALRIGLAQRLAFSLSGSAGGELKHYRIKLTSARVILELPTRRQAVAAEPVEKRLAMLAEAFDRKAEIVIG